MVGELVGHTPLLLGFSRPQANFTHESCWDSMRAMDVLVTERIGCNVGGAT
jgi:hypothetical protein